jgi:hypothetical protein
MTNHDDGKKSRGQPKTGQKASTGARGKVSELARHIQDLGREVEHLKKAARREVEDLWAVHHSDLYPRFLRWQDALGVENFAVYTLAGKELRPEPLLSSSNAPGIQETLTLHKDLSKLSTWWGGSVADLVSFALASRDCQVDFRSGIFCVPIAFYENPRGLILARAKALTPASYGAIVQQSSALLSHVREVALEGQAETMGPMRSGRQTRSAS